MSDETQIWQPLARILGQEAQAIRAGDLQALVLLAQAKAPLVAAAEARAQGPRAAQPGAAEALAGLRRQAAANQRQLGATLKGMRAALRRLDGLRRAGRSLQSYDAAGRPQTIGAPQVNLERRA
ncbi:hypothetical protein GVY41_14490 [Frigidibacter albus]|uniref:Flagellar protein FlgN n=1 Tax=Frigidibacter albus TaxID=1465486 RepID=A0A6L8VIY8_9RHOB|nr:hypothetical protein [Frigidibacter albus]MZQ90295.1 hypothetical protein [Frigidibacter albus]NBE32207.1 hypothetical protein [Frigidibacter albus]GGH58609.1 hypothetical protein GCM10011341_29130 [Frigidibacter albus]